jgi:hypothetical protein
VARCARFLSWAALSPVALSPVALSPVALSPVALSPVALSPVALSPVALSPVAVSPLALCPWGVLPSVGSAGARKAVPDGSGPWPRNRSAVPRETRMLPRVPGPRATAASGPAPGWSSPDRLGGGGAAPDTSGRG